MNGYFQMINAFIEDTCVIIVLAYLLARGGMLAMVFNSRRTRRESLYLGAIFGLIGLTEVIFPGARYPYVTNTLIVSFAAFMVGLSPALLATCLIALTSLCFQSAPNVARTLGADGLSALIGAGFGFAFANRKRPGQAFLAGVCAQSAAVALLFLNSSRTHAPYPLTHVLMSVPANGLGMLLLLLVLNDARIRANSEQHRADAERSHALVAEAQIRAIRARIHPHFLFNSLTSIAALCGIAPDRAESAVVRLSELMRRSLETNLSEPLCLSAEMENVDGYLELEQHRFGPRLHVYKALDPACASVRIPGFAMQTLVENAVNHGVGPKPGPVTLCIVARKTKTCVLLAVADDGAGISTEARRLAAVPGSREHGLQILAAQLALLYGKRARIRLLRRSGGGTLVAFAVPTCAAIEIRDGNLR